MAFNRLQDRLVTNGAPTNLSLLQSPTDIVPARLIYNYIALSVIEQYQPGYEQLSESIVSKTCDLASKFGDLLESYSSNSANLNFGFKFKSESIARSFREQLGEVGIQNLPIERSTVESPSSESTDFNFALNLAYRKKHADLFWDRLEMALQRISKPTLSKPLNINDINDPDQLYEYHRALNFAKSTGKSPEHFGAMNFLRVGLDAKCKHLNVQQITKTNYHQFRQRILDMQTATYEPTRRTSAEEFDMLFNSENPLAIVVTDKKAIVAMVFAGRLGLFKQHGGVKKDPWVNDPTVYYSVDLTVVPEYRGGTGRLLKQALVMLAIDNGVTAIHGRNRDRLAAGMWAINLSLGSYELQHLENDYQDDEPFRDCIYYRCPLRWQNKRDARTVASLPFHRFLQGLDLDQIHMANHV